MNRSPRARQAGAGPSKHAPARPATDRRYECDDKVQYPDRRAARTARRQFDVAAGDHLRIYRCHYGPHYHLGHVRPQSTSNDALLALAERDPLAANELRLAMLDDDTGLDHFRPRHIVGMPHPTDQEPTP